MFKQKEGLPVSFLNVLEDVRIEKMMKQRYPGLRKLMYSDLSEITSKEFFNTKDKSIANMRFIDRINLHYKVIAFAQVPFHNDIEETLYKETTYDRDVPRRLRSKSKKFTNMRSRNLFQKMNIRIVCIKEKRRPRVI